MKQNKDTPQAILDSYCEEFQNSSGTDRLRSSALRITFERSVKYFVDVPEREYHAMSILIPGLHVHPEAFKLKLISRATWLNNTLNGLAHSGGEEKIDFSKLVAEHKEVCEALVGLIFNCANGTSGLGAPRGRTVLTGPAGSGVSGAKVGQDPKMATLPIKQSFKELKGGIKVWANFRLTKKLDGAGCVIEIRKQRFKYNHDEILNGEREHIESLPCWRDDKKYSKTKGWPSWADRYIMPLDD